jgi:hypothetical protein
MYSVRMRAAAACSEVRVKAAVCSEAGDEVVVCSRLGSRTAGGSGTVGRRRWHDLSRAAEEQERVRDQKLLSVAKESTGPEILGRGT